jgi:hypothetical protein
VEKGQYPVCAPLSVMCSYGSQVQLEIVLVVDFAMTTIATRPRAALAAPGGAATRYEQTKLDKYRSAMMTAVAQAIRSSAIKRPVTCRKHSLSDPRPRE